MDPSKYYLRYMEEAEDGKDLGGGDDDTPEDRGDELTPEQVAAPETEDKPDKSSDKKTETEDKTPEKTVTSDDKTTDKKADETGDKLEDKPDDKGGRKEPMIPKSRLDFKNRMLKQSERRIEDLERELEEERKAKTTQTATEKKQEIKLDEKLKELNAKKTAAWKDDNVEKVQELDVEIQSLLLGEIESIKSQPRGEEIDPSRVTMEVVDKLSLNDMIDTVEARFSVLNVESDDFDQDLSDEVLDLYETLKNSDKYDSSAIAMAKAVEYIMGESLVVDPAAAASTTKSVRDTKTNIDKNLDTATKQPANSGGGKDSDEAGVTSEIDAEKLSEKDFDALPEDTKARLRGDYV